MALENIGVNASLFLSSLSPEIASRVEGLITIFKAVGIAFIVYVSYLVIMAIVNIKRANRLRRIEKKVDDINKKLGRFLKSKKDIKKK